MTNVLEGEQKKEKIALMKAFKYEDISFFVSILSLIPCL